MSFKIGDKVRLNPAIATREYLHDCYFNSSIPKLLEMAEKGNPCTIKEFKRDHLRSNPAYRNCAILYDEKNNRLGWFPLEALSSPVANILPPLAAGTILRTRSADDYIVVNAEKAFNINPLGGKENLSNWDKITGKHCSRRDFDIVAVYNPDDMCSFRGLATASPIWTETTPAREMTVAEIEKELGHGIKVVGEDGHEYTF